MKDGFLLHLVNYTPNEAAATVPKADGETQSDLGSVAAPKDNEFLNGELMVFIYKNYVLTCNNHSSESHFQEYITKLAEQSGIQSPDSFFQTFRLSNIDKLKQISKSGGVKNVSLNAVAYDAEIKDVREQSANRRIVSSVIKLFKHTAAIPPDDKEQLEHLKVKVLIEFNKRRGTSFEQEAITKYAKKIIDNDENDGYIIEDMKGNKIRAHDLTLSKKASFNIDVGIAISHVLVWGQLEEYFNELGIIE